MLKLPPCATLTQSIFNSTKLPHPEVEGAEALITSPLPLTLEPPAHDHHLPFYFCPINKKKHTILIDLKFQIL